MATEGEWAACLANTGVAPTTDSFLSGQYTFFKRESQMLAFRVIEYCLQCFGSVFYENVIHQTH